MSATDVTFLINFNSALGMCFGLFSAPLINRFGYRTVAVTGGSSFAIGVALASFSHNFWTFFLSFGMMQGMRAHKLGTQGVFFLLLRCASRVYSNTIIYLLKIYIIYCGHSSWIWHVQHIVSVGIQFIFSEET